VRLLALLLTGFFLLLGATGCGGRAAKGAPGKTKTPAAAPRPVSGYGKPRMFILSRGVSLAPEAWWGGSPAPVVITFAQGGLAYAPGAVGPRPVPSGARMTVPAGFVLSLPAGTALSPAAGLPRYLPAGNRVTLPPRGRIRTVGGCVLPVPRGVMRCFAVMEGPAYGSSGPVSFSVDLGQLPPSGSWRTGERPPMPPLPGRR
jgi:hypothetical protein